MREIKFRAWDEVKKIMHYDFQFVKTGDESNDWILFTSDKQPKFPINEWSSNPYFSQQLKITQFTGLEDLKGEKLYEGDICTNGVAEWEIIFNKGCFCARILGPKYSEDQTHLALRVIKGLVKIGNIYENPQLL